MARRIITAVALLLAMGWAGAAVAGPMDGLYGNTLRVTAANGATTAYLYDADGTVTARAPAGTVAGRWRLAEKDTRICLTFAPEPDVVMPEVCAPLSAAGKKAGDRWDGASPTGKPLKFEIVSGRAIGSTG